MKTREQIKFETNEKIRFDKAYHKGYEEREKSRVKREQESMERALMFEMEKEEIEKRTHERTKEFLKLQKENGLLQKENYTSAKEVYKLQEKASEKDEKIAMLMEENLRLMKEKTGGTSGFGN